MKKIFSEHKNAYVLGQDENGNTVYLEKAKFECGWYWGLGYLETYHGNRWEGHTHFDGRFFGKNKNAFDIIKTELETPFTDDELWKICEIMKSLYTARAYSDMLHLGGSHYTTNPCKEVIKNDSEYDRINKVVIPALLEELYSIMG